MEDKGGLHKLCKSSEKEGMKTRTAQNSNKKTRNQVRIHIKTRTNKTKREIEKKKKEETTKITSLRCVSVLLVDRVGREGPDVHR